MSFEGLLCHSCDIEENNPTNSDSGQQTDIWTSVENDVRCRIEPKSALGRTVGTHQIYEKMTHLMFMKEISGLNIKTDTHRIDWNGDKYTILLVSLIPGFAKINHLEIVLEKVE